MEKLESCKSKGTLPFIKNAAHEFVTKLKINGYAKN